MSTLARRWCLRAHSATTTSWPRRIPPFEAFNLRPCAAFHFSRGCASVVSRDPTAVDSFAVRCGSAGAVTVDIHNADLLKTPSTPLVLYLPPTGVHLQDLHPHGVPRIFDSGPVHNPLRRWPIAQINYRWNITHGASSGRSSPPHPFPTPLHDILHAYTWLTTSFLPSFGSNPGVGSSLLRSPSPYASPDEIARPPLRPLFLYGSFLGGTLASSLSLTESRVGPVGSFIQGVVVQNGVFDWTHVATTLPPEDATSDEHSALLTTGRDGWDLDTLHALKAHLFPSPAAAFDPFASPLLFFRSPGLSIPSYFPGTSPPPRGTIADDDTLLDGLSLSGEEIASLRGRASTPPRSTPDPPAAPSRRSPLRFPPKDSGLLIPPSLFLTTSPSTAQPVQSKGRTRNEVLEEPQRQAEEMARLMRRSIVMHEFKDRDYGDPHAASEDRVQVQDLGRGNGQLGEAEVLEEWIAGLGLNGER